MNKNNVLFSKRMAIAKRAVDWCKDRHLPVVAFNIITAVVALDLMRENKE